MPEGAVDCSPVTGNGYCEAGNVCTENGTCITAEEDVRRKYQAAEDEQRAREQVAEDAARKKEKEQQEKADREHARRTAEDLQRAEARKDQERREAQDRASGKSKTAADIEAELEQRRKSSLKSVVPSGAANSAAAVTSVTRPAPAGAVSGSNTAPSASGLTQRELRQLQRPSTPRVTGDFVKGREEQKKIDGVLGNLPAARSQVGVPASPTPSGAVNQSGLTEQDKRELGKFAPASDAERKRMQDEAARKSPWPTEEEKAEYPREEVREVMVCGWVFCSRCFKDGSWNHYHYKTETQTCLKGKCSGWADKYPENHPCK